MPVQSASENELRNAITRYLQKPCGHQIDSSETLRINGSPEWGEWMSLGRLPICLFLDTRAVPDHQAPARPLTLVSMLRTSDFLINLTPL